MTRAALVMACISGASALGGAAVFAVPTRGEGGTYSKRIAGTMLCALALILGVFAWGLERIAG